MTMPKKLTTILLSSIFFCSLGAVLPTTPPAEYKPDFEKADIYLKHLKRTPLWGWWKVRKAHFGEKDNPNDAGTLEKWTSPSLDDSKWERDIVPNEIHIPFLQKDGQVTDWTGRIQKIPAKVREWRGVMYFRKDFDAPKLEKNERAILCFQEVAGDFKVFVNGKMVGKGVHYIAPINYRGPQDTYEFDITDALRPGKNVLAVRLFHNGTPLRWCWAGKAGILDIVYLDTRPETWTSNILVTPRKDLKNVLFECVLSGEKTSGTVNGWTGEVFEWKSGKKVADVRFGKEYTENGLRLVSAEGRIDNAKLWSWASPFLYGIRVKNASGKITGVQRFGMRTFGVKDGNFVLNGNPVALRGLTIDGAGPMQVHGWTHAMRANAGDAFRKYWTFQGPNSNVNHIRIHSSRFTKSQYDILDELGIIVTDELAYSQTQIKNPARADMIDVKGFDGACDKKGNLHPEFVQKIHDRIFRTYSNPCICTFSFGNEIRQYDDPRVEKLLNNLYDLYHKLDKQQRPTTNSSGRFWKDGSNVKEMHEREKLDYIDTHDYTGSINNFPLAYCEPVIDHFLKTIRKYYGKDMPPVINGETVYMASHYAKNIMDPIWKDRNHLQPDWDKMIYMLEKWRVEHPEHSFLGHYWIRNWGTKAYCYDRSLGRGIYTERILETQRKAWPEYDGYENLSGPYFTESSAYPFEKYTIKPNIAHKYLVRVNNPVIAVLDYIAPNRFNGEKISTNVTAINNLENGLKDIVFEFEIRKVGRMSTPRFIGSGNFASVSDKIVLKKSMKFGDLASNEKKVLPFGFTAPEAPGMYTMFWRLVSNGKRLTERDRELRIRNSSETFRKISSNKKIALYDASAVFGSLKPYSTVKTLKAFGIAFTPIRKFDNLKEFDILILGAESIDGRVEENGDAIRAFVENGGRLLVFDQNYIGRAPFLKELEYVLAGPGQFAEVLKFDHPALKDLSQGEFFCWNQKDWSVYRNYLRPISRAALLTGGNTTQWGADYFGMIAAHLKLGKGDVILTQAEVTKTLRDDSASAKFTRNLLETILDDSTRSKASEFKGLAVPKVKSLSKEKALYISLKSAANRAFKDDAAKNGKGGWTDQGPKNDLAPFPVGEKFFGGVPFSIVNPAENGNRSCIMVSGNPVKKFSGSSKEIAVNAKVKRLLFLHSGGWLDGKNQENDGMYVVTYESGKQKMIPLKADVNIGDWWNASAKFLPQADCVWSAMNGSGVIGVYLFEWKNPNASDKVKSVKLTATSGAVIGLVGLTAEKQ